MAKPFGIVTKAGRFVRQDILEQYAVKSESKKLPPDSFSESYGKLGLVQPLYNPEALARLLELNTYHYRCCRTKARETAGLGWVLKPTDEENGYEENDSYRRLEAFFNNLPEPVSTMFNKAMFDHESIGYGAIELAREGNDPEGEPALLEHIPAHTLRRHKDLKRFVQQRGNKKRWFKLAGYEYDVDFETGWEYELGSLAPERRATEIIWVMNYTPRSDYYGLPDVIPAIGAIHGDLSRRDYNINFFDNYGVPAYAVFITGNYEDEDELDAEGNPTGKTVLESEIEAHFEKVNKNPHSTLILSIPTRDREGEVKVELKPLAQETKEASFRLYRKDNRDEVLSAHGVPPYRAGIAEEGSLGGSTAKESTEIYKRSIIEPRQETLESLINQEVILKGFGIEDWMFEFAEIDTTDQKHDLEICKGLFELGAMTPNQIIRHFKDQFGLEESEQPAMDAHYIKGQPVDLEQEPTDQDEEAEQVLLSLQNRLVEVAEKYAGSGNGVGSTENLDRVEAGKGD